VDLVSGALDLMKIERPRLPGTVSFKWNNLSPEILIGRLEIGREE
jgi:hypothetical protein